MRIIQGVWPEPTRLSPFYEFQVHLVSLIPHSAIAKTVPLRSPNFHIFTSVENQPLKQQLNQKRRIILTNVRHIFSLA